MLFVLCYTLTGVATMRQESIAAKIFVAATVCHLNIDYKYKHFTVY